MSTIIVAIVIGGIIGLMARAIMPGQQSLGVLWTILLGIVGAIIGNYVGEAISPDGTMHWILSVLAAIALLAIVMGVSQRRAT